MDAGTEPTGPPALPRHVWVVEAVGAVVFLTGAYLELFADARSDPGVPLMFVGLVVPTLVMLRAVTRRPSSEDGD